MKLFGFEEFWEALVWKYWRASVETTTTEHNIWKGITGLYESAPTHPTHICLWHPETQYIQQAETRGFVSIVLPLHSRFPSVLHLLAWVVSTLVDSPWVLWVVISTASEPHSTLSGPEEPVNTSSWVVLGWVFGNLPLCSQTKGASCWSAWWLWGTLMWMTMVIWVFDDEQRWNERRWSWWT